MAMESRITHVRFVGLGVPNLTDAVEYYRDAWGLVEKASDDGLVFLGAVATAEPYILRLRESEAQRTDLISFAVPTASDVDAIAAHLTAEGVPIVRTPGGIAGPGGGYGMWFHDPDGRTIEVSSDVASGEARALEEREWLPGKLSHVVLNTTDIEALAAWYGRMLGLGISDRLADFMLFIHGSGPDHHIMAMSRAAYPTINHIAYETRGIDEYLRASGRLMRAGEECVWGPGRHGPGDNTFSYFIDRSGFVAEYTTALEQIDDWTTHVPRVHPAIPEWSDQWGTACARQAEAFAGPRDSGLFIPPPV